MLLFSQNQRKAFANAGMRRHSAVSQSSFSTSEMSSVTAGSGTVVTMKSLAAPSIIGKSSISIRTGSRVSLVEMPAQPTALDIVVQSRNYYKRVHENKDVSKLHLQLCNCINATGKVCCKRYSQNVTTAWYYQPSLLIYWSGEKRAQFVGIKLFSSSFFTTIKTGVVNSLEILTKTIRTRRLFCFYLRTDYKFKISTLV